MLSLLTSLKRRHRKVKATLSKGTFSAGVSGTVALKDTSIPTSYDICSCSWTGGSSNHHVSSWLFCSKWHRCPGAGEQALPSGILTLLLQLLSFIRVNNFCDCSESALRVGYQAGTRSSFTIRLSLHFFLWVLGNTAINQEKKWRWAHVTVQDGNMRCKLLQTPWSKTVAYVVLFQKGEKK